MEGWEQAANVQACLTNIGSRINGHKVHALLHTQHYLEKTFSLMSHICINNRTVFLHNYIPASYSVLWKVWGSFWRKGYSPLRLWTRQPVSSDAEGGGSDQTGQLASCVCGEVFGPTQAQEHSVGITTRYVMSIKNQWFYKYLRRGRNGGRYHENWAT